MKYKRFSNVFAGAFALFFSGALAFFLPQPSFAAVINADIQEGAAGTHSGADGVLSTTGTVWNGLPYNVIVNDLLDELGAATPVDVEMIPPFTVPYICNDAASLNDLQSSGMCGAGFLILNLVQGETYDLAVYGGEFMLLFGTEASGPFGGFCTAGPTYALPGDVGRDYCLFLGLVPFEIDPVNDPGVFGLEIGITDGLITGFQLEGNVGGLPPVSNQAFILIKPDDDPNRINIRSRGNVPVALCGSDPLFVPGAPLFDVADVDVTTLRFGKTGTEASPRHDLTDPGTLGGHTQDVCGPDGLPDLVLHFSVPATGLAVGDTEAVLKGELLPPDGTPFEGSDSVEVF